MSFQDTIARIEEMQKEFEAATGVTMVEQPGPPAGVMTPVAGEFSCERLEFLVEKHLKTVTDLIMEKVQKISELMSKYAPILSLPGNPLKILKWAKKVITGLIDPAISAAIELAIQIAQLAGALAGLVGAVASAISRLAECISNLVKDTLKSITDTVMAGAIQLYDQAIGIYEDLKDQALEELGFNEIMDLKADIKGKVDNLKDTTSQIESSVDSMGDSLNTLSNVQIPG